MLEIATQHPHSLDLASPQSLPSFFKEYSSGRKWLLTMEQVNRHKNMRMMQFIGETIHNASSSRVKEWQDKQMTEGVDYLTKTMQYTEDFKALFDKAKWQVIEDNQGLQDAGEDTWFAKRKSIVDGEEISVNVVLLGRNPDSSLGMRIVAKGLESYLQIDKLNNKWETIHTEPYMLSEEEREGKSRHELHRQRRVSLRGNDLDLEFYGKIVAGLQVNPELLDK